MRKAIITAYILLFALLAIGGTLYVKEILAQAEEATGEGSLSKESKEDLKSKVTLQEEFTVMKSHKTDPSKLNQRFKGVTPTQVTIPAINVEASIERVGLLDSGEMAAPSTEDGVAWYELGAKPGAKGNAVLAGHVDSKSGPAIFYNLKNLKKGDKVQVTGERGTKLIFIVKKIQSYPRSEAPLNDIFGYSDGRSLNLITCTGTFDRAEGTHEERLVVYTELIEKQAKELESEPPTPTAPTNIQIAGNFISWHAVREGNVIGYRIYKKEQDGSFVHIGSVSEHERKTFEDENTKGARYYVTAVNEYGKESVPSTLAK
ncbi:sortase [Priestia aryabhattai]|uniref:class F sortase n=1 Tax=Priestia TaxID=2800373 RepID=UPI000BA0E34B|nr:sortase [Priestia aryabhattai]USY53511.1 sortase [Bacillus sp. 1780r2a1]